jgi:hypothetical protein
MTVTLAGIPFVAVAHHDLRFFRSPGVYALCRRSGAQRTILFVGQADEVSAAYGGRVWSAALEAGMNEALVNLAARARLDRLQILTMVARACAPRLNDPGAREAEPAAGVRVARVRAP